jgi:hypothetical protein
MAAPQSPLLAVLLLLWIHLGNFALATPAVAGTAATAAVPFSAKFLDAAGANPDTTDGSAPLLAKATEDDIKKARIIVREAQEKARELNRARRDRPARNR